MMTMNGNAEMETEETAPPVSHQSLAAWRAKLVRLRDEERQHSDRLSPETGRLLETVGQALAQGGGVLPPDDITLLEALTGIAPQYHVVE
jgi:hypothetical protein